MAVRKCIVSFTGPSGIRHSVEVTAESLYEAAAVGLSVLRKADWTETIAAGLRLEVQVSEPVTTHYVTVAQIRQWCDGAVSPSDVLRRRRVKALLA